MATTEPTINNAIAGVFRELRKAWAVPGVVRSENTAVFEGGGQPDVLIMEPGASPVTVETEVIPAFTVEKDARSRLERVLNQNGRPILYSIAVRIPADLRNLEGTALAAAVRSEATFNYACFTGKTPDDSVRWPNRGWISGNVADLCLACQSMTIPPAVVDLAAERLVRGVNNAAGLLAELAATHHSALRTSRGRSSKKMEFRPGGWQ